MQLISSIVQNDHDILSATMLHVTFFIFIFILNELLNSAEDFLDAWRNNITQRVR